MGFKFVNSAGNEVADIHVNPTERIDEVTTRLEQIVDTPAKFIQILHDGKILSNQKTCEEEGVPNEPVLNLIKISPVGDELQLLSIESDDPRLARYLLGCKADPNRAEASSCYKTNVSCLEYAVLNGFDRVAEVILSDERFDKDNMVEYLANNDFSSESSCSNGPSHLLFEACLKGCTRVVRHLLTHFLEQIDINFEGYFVRNIFGQRGPTGVNCFWAACVSGKVEIVEALLASANEYGDDEDDTEPLKITNSDGCASAVSRRLNLNVMAAYKRDQAFTGFWLACRAGHLEMVKLLLHGFETKVGTPTPSAWISKLGANSRGEVDRTMDLPMRFTTPFQAALLSGNIDLVNFLFECVDTCNLELTGADLEEEATVFQLACCYPAEHECKDNEEGYLASCVHGGKEERSRMLGDSSHSRESEAPVDNSALTTQVLHRLLKHRFPHLTTSLHESPELLQYANRKSDSLQVTAFWWACMYGNLEAVRFLIDEKLMERSEACREKDALAGRTPLWIACCNGHVDVVRFLLDDCGVKPSGEDQRNSRGCTPFEVACAFARREVIRELLPRIKETMKAESWLDALLKVTCVIRNQMCFEDLDCVSSVHRIDCLELLLTTCDNTDSLKEAVKCNILPVLRKLGPFRGRNVEYDEFSQWIHMLEKWLSNPHGQKRKACEMESTV